MKVVKDEQKIALPERLQAMVKQNVDTIANAKQNIDNLVSGFLADKEIPDGVEISISADGKDVLLNPVK